MDHGHLALPIQIGKKILALEMFKPGNTAITSLRQGRRVFLSFPALIFLENTKILIRDVENLLNPFISKNYNLLVDPIPKLLQSLFNLHCFFIAL